MLSDFSLFLDFSSRFLSLPSLLSGDTLSGDCSYVKMEDVNKSLFSCLFRYLGLETVEDSGSCRDLLVSRMSLETSFKVIVKVYFLFSISFTDCMDAWLAFIFDLESCKGV